METNNLNKRLALAVITLLALLLVGTAQTPKRFDLRARLNEISTQMNTVEIDR